VLNTFAGVTAVTRVLVTRVDLVPGVDRVVVVLCDAGVSQVVRVACVDGFPAFPELV
jgi:hypothetical protein